MGRVKKAVGLLVVVVFSLSTLLAACSRAEKNTEPPAGSDTERVALKIWRPANIVDPAKDPILLEVQKKLNIKLEILTAPWDQEKQKLNSMMAASEDLDIVQAPDSITGNQWAAGDLMNDIGELIKGNEGKFPYINSVIHAESFAGLKVGDRAFFIAGTHHGQDLALYIRKDWLDKLGLSMPSTLEEYYDVLKAFKERDPDGNGKADTIGFQACMINAADFSTLEPLIRAFGGSFGGLFEDYVIRNGKVTAAEISDNTKAGLKFANRLYREGIINTDFTSLKNIDEANAKYLYGNKAGSLWTSRASEFEENIKYTDPGATFEVMKPVAARGYSFLKSQGLAWWLLVGVPKASRSPGRALELIEYLNSREGRELIVCGIKGKHYTALSTDGIFDRNRDNWEKDYDVKANGYDYPLWWGLFTTTHGYIPCDRYASYEEAMQHIEIFMDKEDAGKKFNWQTTIKYGALYNEPNPFHAVYLAEVADARSRIENDVKSVHFMKMLLAKSEADIDQYWADYLAAWEGAGGKSVVAAYQKYYDENLK